MSLRAIGITGGVGSGKSEVRKILQHIAYPSIDADYLASTVLSDPAQAIGLAEIFGRAVLLDDGRIDRATLRNQVFASASKRAQLEAFMHPRIEAAFLAWKKDLEKAKLGFELWCFYEAALLIEKDRKKDFDRIVLVTSSMDLRITRLSARGMDEKTARSVMAAQWDDEKKRSKADYILVNDGNMGDLKISVFSMLLWLGDQFAASQS